MKILIDENCPECGNCLELETDAEQPETGYACYDSDSVKCVECGLTGWMTVHEDGEAYPNFEGED